MPIDIEFRHEGVGVIWNCHGATAVKDFFAAKDSLLASPERLKKVRYMIVDVTSMETVSVNFLAMVRITQDERLKPIVFPGMLCAVVSPTDAGYGLSRTWEALSSQSGWEIQIFRSRAEAELWIQQRTKERFGIDLTENPFRA